MSDDVVDVAVAGGPHSEASKLLEAALEQMDGIIQGAKYDLQGYYGFDAAPVTNGNHDARDQEVMTSSSVCAAAAAVSSIPDAMLNLKAAILTHSEQSAAAGDDDRADPETQEFVLNWLRNNHLCSSVGAKSPGRENEDLARMEERILRAEAETDERILRAEAETDERILRAEAETDAAHKRNIYGLQEEINRQNVRIDELDHLVTSKTAMLKRAESALESECCHRAAAERSVGERLAELARLQKALAVIDAENAELRRRACACAADNAARAARPNYLGAVGRHKSHSKSNSPLSSPDEAPMLPAGGGGRPTAAAFANREEDIRQTSPSNADDAAVDTSFSPRPPRGFKKIFGKIARSNSGGQLEDCRGSCGGGGGGGGRSETPEPFRRGGMRATASARLGAEKQCDRALLQQRRPFSEWNVDLICTWLESLGLGTYAPEVQRHIVKGDQLTKLSAAEMETKLGMRNALHRKKLALAVAARAAADTDRRPDRESFLDGSWVLRWLDDVGLPQYKDAFHEARVDGRVLNYLTVDDLFLLKVTNQLHHLSIKRGIQVLRERAFDPDCLTRRGCASLGGGGGAADVAAWTNHRVMEWLRHVDLAEYAPNMRGSGVHGALLVNEHRFNDELMAAILAIPASKTLLRRHLALHFKDLVGRDVMRWKRSAESAAGAAPLTPTAKAKPRPAAGGQFTLKRKKSKAQIDFDDLVCPIDK